MSKKKPKHKMTGNGDECIKCLSDMERRSHS